MQYSDDFQCCSKPVDDQVLINGDEKHVVGGQIYAAMATAGEIRQQFERLNEFVLNAVRDIQASFFE
jgi:hypothetical protein